MEKKNAVVMRLELLHDQWTEFAQLPDARLLRWVVEPNEVRMVEAFLAKEGDEQAGECPDLFLRFETPFEDPAKYGHALREELLAMAEESRSGGSEAGELGDWKIPPVLDGQPGVAAFLEACVSLRSHYESLCEHLVSVLIPKHVEDVSAWRQWLWKAIEHAQAPHVRLVVLEDARALALEPLAEAFPEKVITTMARLEMERALEELSKRAAHLGSPGGQFRDLFVRMSSAATKGNLVKLEKLAVQAVALARAQGWHALAVAAHFVVGGALLGAAKPQEALEQYRRAEKASEEAGSNGDAQGGALRLKSRMAQGAALVAGQQYMEAATLYEEAAPLAHEQEDALMELECWRMASWCCEMAKELNPAWEHCQRAWEIGRAMEEQARVHSTLPYVGEALVRLSHERQGARAAQSMEADVESVLGKDWRPLTAAGGQAS